MSAQHCDTLQYNTITDIAHFFGPTHIYNKDNKLTDIAVAQSGTKAKTFTWGKNPSADIVINEIETVNGTTTISYSCPKFTIYDLRFTIW